MGQIEKALKLGDVDVLVPKEIDRVIQHLATYQNPIRTNMPRRAGSGKAWYLVQRTPATDDKIAFWSPDEKSFTTGGKGTYAEKTFTYRTLGVNGELMRTALLATKEQIDLKTEEIEQRILEFKNKEEWGIIWAKNFGPPDNTENYEFDGIDTQIITDRILRMTGDATGAALSLAKLDELIDLCAPYKPGMLIMSLPARRQLKSAMEPEYTTIDKMEVKGGFRVPSYLEIPIFTSTNVPDALGLNADGYAAERLAATYVDTDTFTLAGNQTADYAADATLNADCGAHGIIAATVLNSSYADTTTTVNLTAAVLLDPDPKQLTTILTGSTTTIYALNLDHLWVGERQKLTYEEIKLSSQYISFDIFEDIAVVMSNPLPHAKLTGVKIG